MNYQWHYNKLIERGKNRTLECYTENHHIIPNCMDGTDDPENLVRLTPELCSTPVVGEDVSESSKVV